MQGQRAQTVKLPQMLPSSAPLAMVSGPAVDRLAEKVGLMQQYSIPDLMYLAKTTKGCSDIHLNVGRPPRLRINGELYDVEGPALHADGMNALKEALLADPAYQNDIKEKGSVDFSLRVDFTNVPGREAAGVCRFRVNVVRAMGQLKVTMRLNPSRIPTLEELDSPAVFRELLTKKNGLVLVTGPTGSGKSTTLAAMINEINAERGGHIITIEAPIEFEHHHKRASMTQREVPTDSPSFAAAIRDSLRQDPNVILVGEIRDRATAEAALQAAETGHLVFSTLHTIGAANTVERIIGMFEGQDKATIRVGLSKSLRAVISQVLVPKAREEGRLAAYEIMVATPGILALIRDSKEHQIASLIETGKKYGMQSLDGHLLDLLRQGEIGWEDTILKAVDPKAVEERLVQEGLLAAPQQQKLLQAG